MLSRVASAAVPVVLCGIVGVSTYVIGVRGMRPLQGELAKARDKAKQAQEAQEQVGASYSAAAEANTQAAGRIAALEQEVSAALQAKAKAEQDAENSANSTAAAKTQIETLADEVKELRDNAAA